MTLSPPSKRPRIEREKKPLIDDYSMWTVTKLRKECKNNPLYSKGVKRELVERLEENDKDKMKMKIHPKSMKRVRETEDQGEDMNGGHYFTIMSPMKKFKTDP